MWESTKLRATRALVTYAPHASRAAIPHVP